MLTFKTNWKRDTHRVASSNRLPIVMRSQIRSKCIYIFSCKGAITLTYGCVYVCWQTQINQSCVWPFWKFTARCVCVCECVCYFCCAKSRKSLGIAHQIYLYGIYDYVVRSSSFLCLKQNTSERWLNKHKYIIFRVCVCVSFFGWW